VSDNYPVLVASSHLPSIREQADRLRCYLADDSNEFERAWLEEQQRLLNAVHSYVRDKKLRAELSQCQRWVELRIGEWLGPAKHTGRPKDNSLPGNELSRDINDRHKQEFRFMAEHKEIVTDIMKNQPGKEITRAALIAEIRASNLREHSPLEWSEEERYRRERVEAGITVVANLRGDDDKHLLDWAESKGLLVRVDRGTVWGNPSEMPADGDRDTVCDHYILHHLPYRPSLLNKIHSLKGKVLACWCYPERCHGDYLAELANNTGPEQKPLVDLEGIDVEDFKLATQTLGIVADFREFTLSANPARVLAGLKDHEKSAFFANLRVISDWIDSVEQIKEKDRQDVPPELP
jgi:hypothetical protein